MPPQPPHPEPGAPQLNIQHERAQLFELTPDLCCVLDSTGHLIEVNPAWTNLLGYDPVSVIGHTLTEFAPQEDRAPIADLWPRLGTSSESVGHECRIRTASSRTLTVLWRFTPTPASQRIFAYGRDITVRKERENILTASERRFHAIADHAPVMLWMTAAEGQFTYYNKPWLDYTGVTLAESVAQGCTAALHTDDADHHRHLFESCLKARRPYVTQYRLRHRSGLYRWVIEHGLPHHDEQGVFSGFIGSSVDITEQHETEIAADRRARQQTMLANLGRTALGHPPINDLLNQICRVSPEVLNVEGCFIAEYVATAGEFIVLAHSAWPQLQIGKNFPATGLTSGSLQWSSADTGPIPAPLDFLTGQTAQSLLAIPVGDPSQIYGLIVTASHKNHSFDTGEIDFLQGVANVLATVLQRRVTENALRASEGRVLQSQKMEAVAVLAGGVAHDFNNLLTGMRCYTEMLRDDLPDDDNGTRNKADEILRVVDRATALTRQLLAFSRRQVVQPEIISLNSILLDIQELLRSLLGESIRLSCVLDPALGYIEADRSQIEQIVMNLAVNARDAMLQGGQLTLRTINRELPDAELGMIPDLPPGLFVELCVTDTGHGMTEEVKAKAFEPFFTTKKKGRGTGLGLATTHTIVRECRGAIRLTSAVGQGTTLQILFPRILVPQGQFEEENPHDTPEGDERILLVEDDNIVRDAAAAILRSLGYNVIVAGDGEEALRLYDNGTASNIDLLLSDVVMPFFNGRELVERIRSRRPTLPCLLMSGYVDDPALRQSLEEASVPFLRKPFNRAGIAQKIREVLDKR